MGGLATIDGTDYWLTVEEGGLWRLGIYPFRQAPLGILAPTEILDLPLPKGNYYFFFVADSEMDGLPSVNWWDVVQVRVD